MGAIASKEEMVEYLADGDGYIPIEQWGKDHWSTFAYLECRCVDNGGVIANPHMRTNARLHREFVATGVPGSTRIGSEYPTRLAGGKEVSRHDDWSCLEDMVNAGLLRAWFRVKRHGQPFGGSEAKVELTDAGHRVASLLRKHKSNGGTFGDFHLDAILQEA